MCQIGFNLKRRIYCSNFEFYIQRNGNFNLLAVSEAAADIWVRPRAVTATVDTAVGVLLVGDPLYTATGLVS